MKPHELTAGPLALPAKPEMNDVGLDGIRPRNGEKLDRGLLAPGRFLSMMF
jgi:hypothetical protein